jgi:hypothetical protein
VVDVLDAAEVQRLVEDLARRQVAPELHRARRAERARQGAPRLRREAQRAPAVAVAHEHRLDGAAVAAGVEQGLDRAVARVGLVGDLERRERHALGELRAERRRDVGHGVVAVRAARGPLPHLLGAEGGLAELGQRGVEELQVHGRRSG